MTAVMLTAYGVNMTARFLPTSTGALPRRSSASPAAASALSFQGQARAWQPSSVAAIA